MTTKDDIQESINQRLVSLPTKLEGGTMQDIIGSVSYELANIIDTRIQVVLDNAFITTADEEHLLIKGNELGINKRMATFSFVIASITNATPNCLIGTDVEAKTQSGIVFRILEPTNADENGNAEAKMICTESGSVGNIEPDELIEFTEAFSGLYDAKITNEAGGYDGYNDESVENYRERILEYIRDNACNSNKADYMKWAKSVPGVKNVVVRDAQTEGAGKVGIYISSYESDIVSENLINKVKEYIQKEQIINADVSVYGLEPLAINITANLTLKEDANLLTVKTNFEELLKDYLNTKPENISYLYVSNLLFETDGVSDVTGYLLNDSESGVAIGELENPVIGEINLNVSEEE